MGDRVKPGGYSLNEKFPSADATALDVQQARSWVRDGETMLTADCEIDGAFFVSYANSGLVISASKLFLTGSGWPVLSSAHAITDYAPAFQATPDLAANWSLVAGNGYIASAVGTASSEYLALDIGSLPVGMVITSVSVPIASAASAGQPGTMPSIQLSTYAPTSTTPTVIGTASDVWSNLAAFQAKHRITLAGLSHTVANALQYRILVTNMGGAGAVAGMKIGRPFITGTLETLRTA